MKLRYITEANNFNRIASKKEKVKKGAIHRTLGYKRPLKLIAQGSFANIYQDPNDDNRIIKITAHREDVINTVRAQRANSRNIVKLYQWPDGKLYKHLPEMQSWAMIVEKIQGEPMQYSTGHFYKLAYNGRYEFAQDWMNAGGSPEQISILKLYDANNDYETTRLAELFGSLNILSLHYDIQLSDFEENIIDSDDRYVIVDLGF